MTAELLGILAGVLLTLGTGIFVASEFALVNLDRATLEQRRDRGEKRLGPTISALRVTSTHLSSAQLGITLTTLLAGYTFEPAISSLLHKPLTSWGVPAGAAPAVGAVTAVVIATLFSMIFGELVPKNFALAVPLATAKVVIPAQRAFTWLFTPVVTLLNGTANHLIRQIGIEPQEELSGARSAEELGYLVRRSAREGLLDQNDATILHRTLTFSELTAAEVMTPRVATITVPLTASAADVVHTAALTGHSRFPVVGNDVDDVRGVVHVKAAYAVPLTDRATTAVTVLMGEPARVPDTAPVGVLLGTLRGRGYQFGVVVDEWGGTSGIVTLEDLVEELLGELRDEHDSDLSDVNVQGASVLLNGALRPDEAWVHAGIRVPESPDYETVAGYVLDQLGRVPVVGEQVAVDRGVLRVERITGARIEQLRYVPNDPLSDPAFTIHDRAAREMQR